MAARMGSNEPGQVIGEINVTPFVDVVLVLLVIFMITAPLLMKEALKVTLPKVSERPPEAVATLGVTVTKEGQVLLNGTLIALENLSESVRGFHSANPEAQAMISADIDARHGDVVRVIDRIRAGGLERFAIQVERQD